MFAGTPDPTKLFRDARSQAQFSQLLDLARRKPFSMFSLEDVRAGLRIRGQRALGVHAVPLTHIIGSEGRHRDFDRRFLPRTNRVEQRWVSIQHAMQRDLSLPPIDVYKISGVYFVRDGNHRVSVARFLGRVDIEATVTELLVEVTLTPSLSAHTLMLQHERSDFLEWTNLHVLRPNEQVEVKQLGGYLDLVRQINLHRACMSQKAQRPISPDEAVGSWYDTVYMARA